MKIGLVLVDGMISWLVFGVAFCFLGYAVFSLGIGS
jgi:hypothetical protein